MVYLNWHQGPTHSLILLPLWAWLLTQVFAWLFRPYSWQLFFIPACLGLAIHIAGDLVTSYGLMLFAPFSTERYSLPLVFVIDPWFSLIIIAGLVTSWLYPDQRTTARAALTGLGIYVFPVDLISSGYRSGAALCESECITPYDDQRTTATAVILSLEIDYLAQRQLPRRIGSSAQNNTVIRL